MIGNTDYYDGIASGYDELHKEEQLKKLELIKNNIDEDENLASFKNSKTILDVGCGSGISTRFFEIFGIKEREGIDPSKELIKIAIKNDPQGKYLVLSAEQINYNKEFDLVISLTAIQNFNDISNGLDRIKKASNKFILTFLKKSEKKEMIERLIEEKFNIIKKIEQEKDVIYFCG